MRIRKCAVFYSAIGAECQPERFEIDIVKKKVNLQECEKYGLEIDRIMIEQINDVAFVLFKGEYQMDQFDTTLDSWQYIDDICGEIQNQIGYNIAINTKKRVIF